MSNQPIDAYNNLIAVLNKNGFKKEASELIALDTVNAVISAPTAPARPVAPSAPPANGGRFEAERAQPKSAPEKEVFHGQSGGVAPLLQLGKIIDRIEQNPSFNNLPKNVITGLLKIKKMTGNAFRYASEKEALFGMQRNPLKDLKSALQNFDKKHPDYHKLPDDVLQAIYKLDTTVDKAIEALPREKGILEKGMDVAHGFADKGRDIAKGVMDKGKGVIEKGKDIAYGLAEKGQEIKQDIKSKIDQAGVNRATRDKQREEETNTFRAKQEGAIKALKSGLSQYKMYKDIFYRLPQQIIKELENIGLGVDDLNNVATAKVACHVNNTLLNYIRSKEAYAHTEPKKINKEAMDFSSIGSLLTLKDKLDDRELSRAIRLAIAAELDAVHLYELIVDSTDNEMVKKVLQSISNEEKIHAGELQELLKKFDPENEKFLEEGKKEVEDEK